MQLVWCHALYSQHLQAVSVYTPLSGSLHTFYWCFHWFSFFSCTASTPNMFLFLLTVGDEKEQAFQAVAACATALLIVAQVLPSLLRGTDSPVDQSLWNPGVHCTPCYTHLGHSQPQFPSKIPFLDGFVMLGCFSPVKNVSLSLYLEIYN